MLILYLHEIIMKEERVTNWTGTYSKDSEHVIRMCEEVISAIEEIGIYVCIHTYQIF